MADTAEMSTLDAPPNAETIADLRDEAARRGTSVGVVFPTAKDAQKRFVASPRGTCVLLNDSREDTFNQSVPADEIADALRAEAS